MPSRNQSMIRRDINRLKDTVERRQAEHPVLTAIQTLVTDAANAINSAWQQYQDAAVAGDKERQERDNAVTTLLGWMQRWRPVLLMVVPGANTNLRKLPSSGATPDDIIRVAEDMATFINSNAGAESIRTGATDGLGDKIASARKETVEASAALPAEAIARQAYTDACEAANPVLIRGTEVIRAIFGRTSPEYKQFIARGSAAEEAELENETMVGEE